MLFQKSASTFRAKLSAETRIVGGVSDKLESSLVVYFMRIGKVGLVEQFMGGTKL